MRELSACRKAILNLLHAGESTAIRLAVILGREHTNVSRDLRFLRDAGLVSRQLDGRRYLYSLTAAGAKR
jgi:DNA-binding transcriptional ArsR family regulator